MTKRTNVGESYIAKTTDNTDSRSRRPATVKELCEIPPAFRRAKSTPAQGKAKDDGIDTPEKRWKAAQARAHDIAESCRLISEKCRLEKNEAQLAEYHKTKKFYKGVEKHLSTQEAKDNRIDGKVTAEEKSWANVYMRGGVDQEKLAKEILKRRMIGN